MEMALAKKMEKQYLVYHELINGVDKVQGQEPRLPNLWEVVAVAREAGTERHKERIKAWGTPVSNAYADLLHLDFLI